MGQSAPEKTHRAFLAFCGAHGRRTTSERRRQRAYIHPTAAQLIALRQRVSTRSASAARAQVLTMRLRWRETLVVS